MKVQFFKKPIVCFLIFLASSWASAGAVKDVYLMHERAVSLHLWGTEEPGLSSLKNTRFVKADPGQFIAMASDVQVYDPKANQYQWITCTTQFSGTSRQDIQLTSVKCQD